MTKLCINYKLRMTVTADIHSQGYKLFCIAVGTKIYVIIKLFAAIFIYAPFPILTTPSPSHSTTTGLSPDAGLPEKLQKIKQKSLSNILFYTIASVNRHIFLTKNIINTSYIKIPKADIHTKIDYDILDWLKSDGKGYQARLNAALRFAMNRTF
ncbi:hypothetical protein FACS1894142_6900 [Spirochaetia bacterium]|nr:hypothetical protein FACS1894142_6900 [Spirochaetia bacterium]